MSLLAALWFPPLCQLHCVIHRWHGDFAAIKLALIYPYWPWRPKYGLSSWTVCSPSVLLHGELFPVNCHQLPSPSVCHGSWGSGHRLHLGPRCLHPLGRNLMSVSDVGKPWVAPVTLEDTQKHTVNVPSVGSFRFPSFLQEQERMHTAERLLSWRASTLGRRDWHLDTSLRNGTQPLCEKGHVSLPWLPCWLFVPPGRLGKTCISYKRSIWGCAFAQFLPTLLLWWLLSQCYSASIWKYFLVNRLPFWVISLTLAKVPDSWGSESFSLLACPFFLIIFVYIFGSVYEKKSTYRLFSFLYSTISFPRN